KSSCCLRSWDALQHLTNRLARLLEYRRVSRKFPQALRYARGKVSPNARLPTCLHRGAKSFPKALQPLQLQVQRCTPCLDGVVAGYRRRWCRKSESQKIIISFSLLGKLG